MQTCIQSLKFKQTKTSAGSERREWEMEHPGKFVRTFFCVSEIASRSLSMTSSRYAVFQMIFALGSPDAAFQSEQIHETVES